MEQMSEFDQARYIKAAKRVLLRWLPKQHSDFESLAQQVAYAMWEESTSNEVKIHFREQLAQAALKDAFDEGFNEGYSSCRKRDEFEINWGDKEAAWAASYTKSNFHSDDWFAAGLPIIRED